MADLLRIGRLFLYLVIGLLLGGISTYASANYPATLGALGNGNIFVDGPTWFSQMYVSNVNYVYTFVSSGPNSNYSTLLVNYTSKNVVLNTTTNQTSSPYLEGRCLNGGTLSTAVKPWVCVHTCPQGTTENTTTGVCMQACVAPLVNQADGSCGCPPGKTLEGGQCLTACPTDYHRRVPDNGTCEKNCIGDQTLGSDGVCVCPAGKSGYYSGSKEYITNFQGSGDCSAGCQIKAGFLAIPFLSGLQWVTSSKTTGATCSGLATVSGVIKATLPPPAPPPIPTPETPADPRETPKNNADPDSCSSSGGIYYSSGGVGKCASPTPDNAIDNKKLTSGTKTTTTQNPDGTSTTKTVQETIVTDGVGGSSSSSTTTTTTKNAAGGTTGTTTTTDSGGGTLGGGGNGDGTKGFCQQNPNSIICKPSAWSGDCDIAPVCDGDAVQCATAKAVWEHRCVNKWAEKSNDLSAGVDQTKLFGDTAKATAALNNDGSKDWDVLAKFQAKRQTYLTFSSSCSPDLSFDFKGQHYQFDTSVLCQFGLVIKILLHLSAYMFLIRLLTVKLF